MKPKTKQKYIEARLLLQSPINGTIAVEPNLWTKPDTILLRNVVWRTSEYALMPLPRKPLQVYEPLHSGALSQDYPWLPFFL